MAGGSNLTRFLLTDLVGLDSRGQLSIACVMGELTKPAAVTVRLRIDLLAAAVACKHDSGFKLEHNSAEHSCPAVRNSKTGQE